MAANKFATMLHRNSSKVTVILVYTVLEWILIILLLLNSLFSYLIAKFAAFFGLKSPCLWCSRIDQVFESGKNGHCYRDLVCQEHAVEISKLGFCLNHGKLAEACDMCEDCSFSQPLRTENRIAFVSLVNRKGISIDRGLKMENGDKDLKCSCCNSSLNGGFYSKILWNHGLFKPSLGVLDLPQKRDFVKEDVEEAENYQIEDRGSHDPSKPESPVEQIKVNERFLGFSDSEEESRNRAENRAFSDGFGGLGGIDCFRSQSFLCEESEGAESISEEAAAEADDAETPISENRPALEGNSVLESSENNETLVHEFREDASWEIMSMSSVDRPVLDRLIPIELIDSVTVKTQIQLNSREQDTRELFDVAAPQPSEDDSNGHQGDGFWVNDSEFQEETTPVTDLTEKNTQIFRELNLEKLKTWGWIEVGDDDSSVLPAENANGNEIGETKDLVSLAQATAITSSEKNTQIFGELNLEKLKTWGSIEVGDDDSSVLPAENANGNEIGETKDLVSLAQATAITSSDGDIIEAETVKHSVEHPASEQARRSISEEVDCCSVSQPLFETELVEKIEECINNHLSISTEVNEVVEEISPSTSSDGDIIEAEAETVKHSVEHPVSEQAKKSNSEEVDCCFVSQPISETELVEKIEECINNHLSISTEVNEVEEEKVLDTPTSMEGIHALHKRFMFEKRESGTESLDGNVVSELEGGEGAVIECLKTALKGERKALSALYAELEEERSASAIAANQTMAMITRLQEEKAAVQMEALQYQRMMEEQSEYDQEALQLLNELMVKREKEKQELEKELDLYRKKVLLYEAKEKRMRKGKANENEAGQITNTQFARNGISSISSSAEDSDGVSIDLNEGDDGFYGLQDSAQHTPVNGVLTLGKGQESTKPLTTLDESLADFEKERNSILEQLKVLEEKLFSLSDDEELFENSNGTEHFSEEIDQNSCFCDQDGGVSSNRKHQIERRNMGPRAKRLLPLFDAIENEEGFDREEEPGVLLNFVSKFKPENKQLSIEEEVDLVYERLQALEADREFLRHCISSLKKGDKGMDLLQEILQHLRDLRTVELRARNMGDALA